MPRAHFRVADGTAPAEGKAVTAAPATRFSVFAPTLFAETHTISYSTTQTVLLVGYLARRISVERQLPYTTQSRIR